MAKVFTQKVLHDLIKLHIDSGLVFDVDALPDLLILHVNGFNHRGHGGAWLAVFT